MNHMHFAGSTKGWINSIIFEEYITKIFIPGDIYIF